MAYNSDGYIMIDFTEVDFRRTNQTIEGLFKRCVDVIGTNKFILVINANGRTPLPATCSFTNNQYVIDTVIYMFAVSSNDNLFIRRNDVPASDIIDDSSISVDKTWSSNKIDSELDTKADASALADYQPLLTPGINITIDENNVISSTGGAVIDDSVIVNNKVWSSLNTVEMLAPIDTIINNPAVFNTSLELPLVECSTRFAATQEGTGDPAPDNVRNIIGVDDITLTVNGNDVVIDLDGSRYGGYLDVVNKKLIIEYVSATYDGSDDENWLGYTAGNGWQISPANMKTGTFAGDTNVMCNILKKQNVNNTLGVRIGYNNAIIQLCQLNNILEEVSLNGLKSWLSDNNLEVSYPLSTSIEISLSDIPTILTAIGANSIESNTGNIKVSYRHLPIDLI